MSEDIRISEAYQLLQVVSFDLCILGDAFVKVGNPDVGLRLRDRAEDIKNAVMKIQDSLEDKSRNELDKARTGVGKILSDLLDMSDRVTA